MYLSVVECLPFCPYIVKRQSVRPLSVWQSVVERQFIRSCPSQPFTAVNAQNLPEFNCRQFSKLCCSIFTFFSRMQVRDRQKTPFCDEMTIDRGQTIKNHIFLQFEHESFCEPLVRHLYDILLAFL